MEQVIKYKANDGSEWTTAEKARERDVLFAACEAAMGELKHVPSDMRCGWYVQQDLEALRRTKQRLFDIANTSKGILKRWIDQQMQNHSKTEYQMVHEVHVSLYSQMLDEDDGPLCSAYHRLRCIDDQCREWNQPYYVDNIPESPKCVW